MPKSLGFMYIAKRACGRISAAAWDDSEWNEADKHQSISKWKERGDTVERIERFDGEPMPEWICEDRATCKACEKNRKEAIA